MVARIYRAHRYSNLSKLRAPTKAMQRFEWNAAKKSCIVVPKIRFPCYPGTKNHSLIILIPTNHAYSFPPCVWYNALTKTGKKIAKTAEEIEEIKRKTGSTLSIWVVWLGKLFIVSFNSIIKHNIRVRHTLTSFPKRHKKYRQLRKERAKQHAHIVIWNQVTTIDNEKLMMLGSKQTYSMIIDLLYYFK